MKKIIVIVLAVLGLVLVVGGLRYRMMSRNEITGMVLNDLIVTNDTSDMVSDEYTENGKELSDVVNPGQKATGGKGVMRIFTANKEGSYELMYEFPRPAGSVVNVTISQIIDSVKKEKFEGDLYIKKGMIGDIKVTYEQIRDFQSTY